MGFMILLRSIYAMLGCKTFSKAKLVTSDKQSTRVIPQQIKMQWSSHWKEMSQNSMMWKVDPRFACKQNLSGKRRKSQASTGLMLRITHMLATIALSELSITVSMERRTFLSNRCNIEMHYLYQISRMQLSFVASPRHDFLEKTHFSQDVTLCLPFYSLKEN